MTLLVLFINGNISDQHVSVKDEMDLVKVVLLGATGVGKTSIVERFLFNEFSEKYIPTEQKKTFYPTLIINDHCFEVKIIDLPVIPFFPVNSYGEWADYRFYGLRSANAYILVYDLNDLTTFTFVRTIREQILKSRDMKRIPLLIVGNKADLIGEVPPADCNKRKDIFNLVVKHWGCPHVESSARHNLGVIRVFKELLIRMDELDPRGHGQKEINNPMIDNINEALDGNKCNIL